MADWILPVSCIALSAALGISLSISNLSDKEARQARLEARREFKKEKNRRLAKALGIPYDK